MAEQRRLAYLEAMGIQAWRLRVAPPRLGSPVPEGEGPGLRSSMVNLDEVSVLETNAGSPCPLPQEEGIHGDPLALEEEGSRLLPETVLSCNWDELQARVKACTACPLHQTRTQTVFGVGDPKAGWMVIGEAPGEQEDLQGEPFVGRAGLLLNEMLRAIGLAREQVFIANILKCRPPKNRDPQPDEVAACEGHLKQQLALVQPKIILAVGRIAAQNLLKTTTPIGKLRGRVHDYQGVPLVVTYHPAYLLRSPLEKRSAFDDLRLARQTYRKISPP